MPHIINFVHASPPQPSTAVHAYAHRSLDGLLSFRGSEGSSDVVLCTNTAEVVCQGRHLARAQHIRVSGRVTSVPTVQACLKLIPKPMGAYNWNGKNYDMPQGVLTLWWRLYKKLYSIVCEILSPL